MITDSYEIGCLYWCLYYLAIKTRAAVEDIDSLGVMDIVSNRSLPARLEAFHKRMRGIGELSREEYAEGDKLVLEANRFLDDVRQPILEHIADMRF